MNLIKMQVYKDMISSLSPKKGPSISASQKSEAPTVTQLNEVSKLSVAKINDSLGVPFCFSLYMGD